MCLLNKLENIRSFIIDKLSFVLRVTKIIVRDLVKWPVRKIAYNLIFLYAYWKTRRLFYDLRKAQTLIVIFGIITIIICASWPGLLHEILHYVCNTNVLGIIDGIDYILTRWLGYISQGSNLVVFIGVVITLYCFLFNVQRNISSASTTFSDWRIITLILYLSFPCIIKLLNNKAIRVINFREEIIHLLSFWGGLWFIIHISNVIARINVVNLFNYVLNCYRLYCNALLFIFRFRFEGLKNTILIQEIFNGFTHIVLSVYQIFIFFIKNELIGIFRRHYDKWKEKCLFLSFQDFEDQHGDKTGYFIKAYPKYYLIFYKASVRCQYMLIRNLYEKGYITEGYIAVEDFFTMSPYPLIGDNKLNLPELPQAFISALSEITLYFYNNNISLTPIFNNIIKFVIPVNIDDTIALYRVLLIKASERQDVKAVIGLSYNLNQTVSQVWLENDTIISEIESNNLERTRYIGRILYIYLCTILKSIELGHKDIVVFLVKFLVSEFKGKDIEMALEQLREKLPYDPKYDSHAIGGVIGINSFNINNETRLYCFEKMVILLYGQQCYIKNNQIVFNRYYAEECNIESFLSDKCFYILDKIYTEQYALLWLKDFDQGRNFRSQLRSRLFELYGIRNADK